MKVLLAIFIVASAGSSAISAPTLDTLVTREALVSAPSTSVQARWDAVRQYIATHATRTDAETEALLKAEVTLGVSTWTVFAGSDADALAKNSLFDGPGLGWPSAGRVINFATPAEAVYAAALILQCTVVVAESPLARPAQKD